MLDHPEDYGPPFSPQMLSKAGIIQNFAGDAVVGITNKTIELLGANGLSPEYHVEKYFRDGRVTTIYEGTSEIQRLVIARKILDSFKDYIDEDS